MPLLLRTLGWIVCVVYSTIPLFWLMIHPRAHSWRKWNGSPFRVLVPAWGMTWLAVGALTASWRHAVLYSTPWSWIPAGALFVVGFWIYRLWGGRFWLSPVRGGAG